jgi:hypothetical protein
VEFDGSLARTAAVSNETTTGWQVAKFANPVRVSASTTYVASYHAPSGHYADDTRFFSWKGIERAPLHAAADGVDGANGVYGYGSSGTYPANGYLGSNYWVDVAFNR